MNETALIDPREYQNIIISSVQEAFRSNAPSWLESLVGYIRLHPYVSIGIVLSVILIISAIIREIICYYFKTNQILVRLDKIEEMIKKEKE